MALQVSNNGLNFDLNKSIKKSHYNSFLIKGGQTLKIVKLILFTQVEDKYKNNNTKLSLNSFFG